jgi:hypothetical protein
MKKWQIVAIVAGVLVVGTGIGVGVSYLVVKNTQKNDTKPTSTNTVNTANIDTIITTPVSTNTTTASLKVSQDPNNPVVAPAEKWTGEITLTPANKSLLSQKISKSNLASSQVGNCGAGVVNFFTKLDENKNPSLPILSITNKNIDMGGSQKVSFDRIYSFIKDQKFDSKNFNDGENLVFGGLCENEGFSSLVGDIQDEIKPIKVIGLDSAVTFSGYIYGIKGDYLLRYRNSIQIDPTTNKNILDKCQSERNNDPSVTKELINCVEKNNLQLPNYSQLKDNAIQELLTIFAL